MQVNQIITGDCLEVMKGWLDNSVDAIVTDIPYGIGFMGKEWDNFKPGYRADNWPGYENQPKTTPGMHAGKYDHSRNAEYQEWCRVWSKEALRIAKPGAFLLCFGGTRTYHRVTCGLEDAGWQIRDCMMWLYGSGFPKSHDISKAIDKAKGAKGETYIDEDFLRRNPDSGQSEKGIINKGHFDGREAAIRNKPATDLAKFWDGYGTALKPAWEPIIVAMKPLDGTFAQNAEAHGVAGLNINAARIGSESVGARSSNKDGITRRNLAFGMKEFDGNPTQGRWPANVILDEEAAAMLDEQSETSTTGNRKNKNRIQQDIANTPFTRGQNAPEYTDFGGASRFFYCAKASKSERNAGLKGMRLKETKRHGARGQGNLPQQTSQDKIIEQNHHPTVKPLKLMEYLCTLLKPPSEHPILLDPFCGSGTTLMAAYNTGWDYIGIDKEAEYVEITKRRVAWCEKQKQNQQQLFPA